MPNYIYGGKSGPVHNHSQISGSSAARRNARALSLETLVSLIRLYKATATKPNTALRPQGARRISLKPPCGVAPPPPVFWRALRAWKGLAGESRRGRLVRDAV